MAVMSRAQFSKTVEPTIAMTFDGIYNKYENEWKPFFTESKAADGAYEQEVRFVGFDSAKVKEEGEAYQQDTGSEGPTIFTRYTTFSLGFALTEELREDNRLVQVGTLYAKHLAAAMTFASELNHQAVFNNAFDPAYPIYDGGAFLRSDHPLERTGGVYSNILDTPADLSEVSLEKLLTRIRKCPDDTGKNIKLGEKRTLIVDPDLSWEAERILLSTLRAGNAAAGENTINVLKRRNSISEIAEMSYLTDPNAWFIHTHLEGGMRHKYKRKLKKGSEGDFSTGNMMYKASERYGLSVHDWRVLWGSQGAAA